MNVGAGALSHSSGLSQLAEQSSRHWVHGTTLKLPERVTFGEALMV